MAREFVDTNVLVYANDPFDAAKQDTAIELLQRMIVGRTGVVSTQVVLELAAVLARKLRLPPEQAVREVELVERLEVVTTSPAVIRDGLTLMAAYSLSIWDATIVAAALRARCDVLWSKDLGGRPAIQGLAFRSPFSDT